ncbi:NADH-ubiquinone/plastoquinone oxidoreductase chain 6 [Fibrella aestuarina BUZ 2]|uniref:NADH-quinone oxidoreductase subunit J n=1 Tax=Fibrella aestuarina BUZ 2 TaxID=1166018 RepID=I0K3S2_9BACT|nr:NADH-quinone oxidoreductase subunit J [Fibrella aestuarina]CCG98775.1 NADH-ubiquinone/plastoquinone oxidoreductase chain 6 [Fibrella aestuarina BUZ 2]
MNQVNSLLGNLKNLTAAGYLFYGLGLITLISAISVVTARNPIHSVLALIFTFFCLTGHYMLLNAQFLAIVNIIVYAGAIMVLFLFAIMFLNLKSDDEDAKTNLTKMAATIVGGVLMVLLLSIFNVAPVGTYDPSNFDTQTGLVERLGIVLYSDYILPFELASVLFLIAMVGAVMLGKREAGDPHF